MLAAEETRSVAALDPVERAGNANRDGESAMGERLRFVRTGRRVARIHRDAVGDWRDARPHHPVGDVFTSRFEAYGVVFHAIYRDPDVDSSLTWDDGVQLDELVHPLVAGVLDGAVATRGGTPDEVGDLERVRWSDLLDEPLSADTNWPQLDGVFGSLSWPLEILGPDEDEPDDQTIARLIAHLEDRYGAATKTWMFIDAWESWISPEYGTPDEGVLAKGSIRSVIRFRQEARWPRLWWDARRRWVVATGLDSCTTVVGGTEALIGRLLEDPHLEMIVVDPTDILFPRCNCLRCQ
jgi:hypothetical protein